MENRRSSGWRKTRWSGDGLCPYFASANSTPTRFHFKISRSKFPARNSLFEHECSVKRHSLLSTLLLLPSLSLHPPPHSNAASPSMSTFRNIDVKAPHIQALQHTIQLELSKRGLSPEDDPVMAEYIVVMLANQKTREQITDELQELIGSEYDGSFTDWVWAETGRCLERQEASSSTAASAEGDGFAARSRNARQQRRSRSPAAMRAGGRAQRRSRSPEATGAVGRREEQRRRSRSPPAHRRGPRPHRDFSSIEAWKESSAPRIKEDPDFDGAAHWKRKAEERRRNPPPPVSRNLFDSAMNAAQRGSNAQRELFPTVEVKEEVKAETTPPPAYPEAGISIFGRAGIPDPRAPAFVPSSAAPPRTEFTELSSAPGTSILSRIDPMIPNNEPLPPATTAEAVSAGHSSDFPSAPTETSLCRWNLGCTNPMCQYSHATPANAGPGGDPNALVLSQQNCRYGARCTNKDCTRSHVSPAVARIQGRAAPPPTSAFTPVARPMVSEATLSMDAALPSQTGSRPCRFGASCSRTDCFFSHPPGRTLNNPSATPCRFGLGCTRPDCFFSHPPGQRAAFATGGTVNRLQVFSQTSTEEGEEEEMEVIIPGTVVTDASSTIASSSPQTAPVPLST